MTELDYAFIAEYAKVEGGKLTVLGASYTEVRVPSLPYPHVIAVAGRIRTQRDAKPFPLKVTFNPPGAGAELVIEGMIHPETASQVYADKAAVLFTVTNTVVMTEPGLCEVLIELEGDLARRLAFDVVANDV